jgi:hypothetical protein
MEKLDLSTLKCVDALKLVSKMLTLAREEEHKTKTTDLELSWITSETNWEFKRVPDNLVAEAKAWAKAQIERDEMGSDDDVEM